MRHHAASEPGGVHTIMFTVLGVQKWNPGFTRKPKSGVRLSDSARGVAPSSARPLGFPARRALDVLRCASLFSGGVRPCLAKREIDRGDPLVSLDTRSRIGLATAFLIGLVSVC